MRRADRLTRNLPAAPFWDVASARGPPRLAPVSPRAQHASHSARITYTGERIRIARAAYPKNDGIA